MILDIITAALIVVPMGIGMARGFLYIALRLLGWIAALAGGIFAAPMVREFLSDGFVGQYVQDALELQFQEGADGVNGAAAGLPAVLQEAVQQAADSAADLMAETLQTMVMTVISFLAVAILIRLLLILVIRPLSRRRGRSPVAFLNKVLGLLTGSIEGLLLAFLFLAALIPAMQISSPETAAAIAEGLKFSYLAGNLYDGNLLLAIFG